MKYKVTSRGWIVFSTLALLLILLGYHFISGLLTTDDSQNVGNEIVEDSAGVEDEINTQEESADPQSDSLDENTDADSQDDQPAIIVDEEQNEISTPSDSENELDYSKYNYISENIYFNKNIADLQPAYIEILDEWIKILEEYILLSIEIEGHINGYPYYDDGPYGLGISEERATIIKDYLVDHGIEEERISIVNKGSSDQAVMSDDMNQHHLNRRAVLIFEVPTE